MSSGGILPVSVAIHGDLVYVANCGASDTNYTGFSLAGNRQLRPIPGSTVRMPTVAARRVIFNSTGRNWSARASARRRSTVSRWAPGGRLTAAPGSPFIAQGLGPFGSEFRPTDPDQLFVSNAHNTAADSGTVSAFRDSGTGRLTSIGASPFPDGQMAPCWVEISADGQFLFTVNTGVRRISRYFIHGNGVLTLLGSTPVQEHRRNGAVDARLSPDGQVPVRGREQDRAVAVFAVNRGDLTELASSPVSLPAGATPAGVVVS